MFRRAVGHLVVVEAVAGKVLAAAAVAVELVAAPSLSPVDGRVKDTSSSQAGDTSRRLHPLAMEDNQHGETRTGLNKVTNSSRSSKEAGVRYVINMSRASFSEGMQHFVTTCA
jgi:hypothetical protein